MTQAARQSSSANAVYQPADEPRAHRAPASEPARPDAKSKLFEALEYFSEGFALYDESEKLIVSNQKFIQMYPSLKGILVPGKTMEQILRARVDHGLVPEAEGRRQEWIDATLKILRSDAGHFNVRDNTGRWIQTRVRRTDTGLTLVTGLDVTEQKEVELELARHRDLLDEQRRIAEHESLHDGLTGLANRRGFERELSKRLLSLDPKIQTLALLQVDLDRFKEINDTHGHGAGDHVLQHVGKVLRNSTRSNDFVARIGGDEFVVLTQFEDDPRPIRALAIRLIEKLSHPVRCRDELCRVGASIGISLSNDAGDDQQLEADRLMTNADMALYRAKELGRGQFQFFAGNLRRSIEEKMALAEDISLAVRRGEFVPLYQPVFDASSGEIVAVEALARWRHPNRGILTPEEFLGIAKRTRADAEIDLSILRQAINDRALWGSEGAPTPAISINLSRSSFQGESFFTILKCGAKSQQPFALEVSEEKISDLSACDMQARIHALKCAGLEIVIDDFGSRHASLNLLVELQPSRIKLAKRLCAPEHKALVALICDNAHGLGISVIGKGVETEQQADTLIALGCDRLQGNLYSGPVSASELLATFHNRSSES